ncbi:MAG: DNA polymerase III subunit delta [Erysipelotrichaceae bacterium]|nr:DNA polymerase III subunit delta [Erysipelotrichaceae bacterium]
MNIVLYGNDQSRMKQNLEQVKKRLNVSNIVYMDTKTNEFKEVLWELDSVSIFDEQKMIVLDHCSFLSGEDETNYDLEQLTKRKDANVYFVCLCYSPKLSKKKSANKKFLQTVSSNNLIPCMALDEKNKRSYIQDYCKRIGLYMETDALNWFCTRVGMDTMRIESELDKLYLYSSHIYLKDVEALVCAEPLQNVFKMVDALKDRNALRILAYYRNFRQTGMAPTAINALLAGQMRFLFQVKILMESGYSQDDIVQKCKTHPYRVQLTMKESKKHTCEELLNLLDQFSALDQNFKTGKQDMDQGFEQFVFDMLIENKKEG